MLYRIAISTTYNHAISHIDTSIRWYIAGNIAMKYPMGYHFIAILYAVLHCDIQYNIYDRHVILHYDITYQVNIANNIILQYHWHNAIL